MKNYADYGFYVTEFNGSLSNDLFSNYIVKASRVIDRNVNRKLTVDVINSLSKEEQYDLKYVACELTDYLKEKNKPNSISIDGVSITKESYYSDSKDDLQNILDNLPQELTRYL